MSAGKGRGSESGVMGRRSGDGVGVGGAVRVSCRDGGLGKQGKDQGEGEGEGAAC